MIEPTSRGQWLGFALLVAIVIVAVVTGAAIVASGWSGCACTTDPDPALSGLGTLW